MCNETHCTRCGDELGMARATSIYSGEDICLACVDAETTDEKQTLDKSA